jgi:GT2 family glycosyltransferase
VTARCRDVGVVVIGRNEGARLKRCLESLDGRAAAIVYVDSGSTDESVASARAAGAVLVTLDMSRPFTAARARNAGVDALAAADPDRSLDFVQFVDGDCAVHPDWIAAARGFLAATPEVAAVCGRLDEMRPEASIYNRLCAMEWRAPAGEAKACGGNAMMRLSAFRDAGGFDPSLIAGEEPDLCFRMRTAGWRVWRLDAPMARHDAAMTRFCQWWRRAIRGGWAFAEGAARHGASTERYNRRQMRSILIWGAAGPTATMTAAVAALFWPPAALMTVAAAAAYAAMAARIAAMRRRVYGDSWADAALYGGFTMLGKVPQALGAARYQRWRGQPSQIIEYKS